MLCLSSQWDGGLDSKTSPEILSIELPSVGEHHCPGRHVETNGKGFGREKDLDEALLIDESDSGGKERCSVQQ